jgi:hypothetical protein
MSTGPSWSCRIQDGNGLAAGRQVGETRAAQTEKRGMAVDMLVLCLQRYGGFCQGSRQSGDFPDTGPLVGSGFSGGGGLGWIACAVARRR